MRGDVMKVVRAAAEIEGDLKTYPNPAASVEQHGR